MTDNPHHSPAPESPPPAHAAPAGIVYLVGAGPGDPGLITVRAIECLRQADVVIYDRLIGRVLLDYAPDAIHIDVGKQSRRHVVPQDAINALLIEHARAGRTVVRLKGGDPFVFGRGGEEAIALVEAGIPFEVVPGVTSAVAGPAFAGIPVTHRGVACNVAVITGHRGDEYPDEPLCDWSHLAAGADTLVFLMGFHNLPAIVGQLLDCGRSPETPVAVIERASYPSQRTVIGTLATIVEDAADLCPPVVIVVGKVVGLHERLSWFDRPDRRPLRGWRVVNTLVRPRRGDLTRRLWALGAEAVEMPALTITPCAAGGPLDRVIHSLAERHDRREAQWDWLVFGAAEGIRTFFDRLRAAGCDARQLAGTRLAALDAAGAAALRQHGLNADWTVTQADHKREWLTACRGRRILVLDDAFIPPATLTALGEAAASLEAVASLEVSPGDLDTERLRRLSEQGVNAVVLGDLPTLRTVADQLRKAGMDHLLHNAALVCGNAAIAEAARALKLTVAAVAESSAADDLTQALLEVRRLKSGRNEGGG